ncbi:MAG: hypothetical protein ACLFRG_05940 [Desulfococcaceae bacterium]
MAKEKLREIEPLAQVTFSLRVTGENENDPGSETFPQKLIVGLGASGMAPFEQLLMGRQAGETVSAAINRSDLPDFFGPLPVTPPPLPKDADHLRVSVDIQEITKPDGREMIRAMAAQVHDCGGGCGCGCGGH